MTDEKQPQPNIILVGTTSSGYRIRPGGIVNLEVARMAQTGLCERCSQVRGEPHLETCKYIGIIGEAVSEKL